MSDAPQYTQAGRLLRIDTPLGEDVLLLESFDGHEEISELFAFTAVVRSKRDDLKPFDLVGKLIDVSLNLRHGEADAGENQAMRTWNLLCVALHEGEMVARGMRHYTLTLRPQLWLLTRRSDCRIWLDRTSTEVCQTLLSEHGLPAPDTSGLVGPVPPPRRDYSVQWNETDLAFLDRRLEQDGVFYWWEHARGRHVMHLANHQAAYQDLQPEAALRMARGSTDRNHIHAFDRTYHFIPSARAGRDWNFETPARPPEGQGSSAVRGLAAGGAGGAKYELYEYPGRFMDAGAGDGALRQRMQASEAGHDQVVGATRVRTLMPARRFTPHEVPHPDRTYEAHVPTKVSHHASDPTYDAGSARQGGGAGGAGGGASGGKEAPSSPSYVNSFEATPASVPATPHRDTPQPRIDGAQVALVAGPAGEEIHTDKYGRVKLRFPWDRRAKGDGSDTVWVRVGQPWAGGTWGAQVIPRVGMEVLVTYQDGDPDRPLVVGAVPNPANPVPYGLPDNKTRMVFRSQTYKGAGFNELAMEDQPGAERLHVHAQHDHTTKVGNNQTERVDQHQVQSVGGSRSVEVAGHQKHEIGGSMTLTVGGVGAMAAGVAAQAAALAPATAGLLSGAGGGGFAGSLASMALGFLSSGGLGAREGVVSGPSPRADAGEALAGSGGGVGGAVAGLFGMSGVMNTVVGAFRSDTVGVASAEQVGVAKVVHVGVSYTTQVGQTHLLKVGGTSQTEAGQNLTIDVGQKMDIRVGESFSVTVGQTRLEMDKMGTVAIEGAVAVLVKGGGAAQLTVGPGPVLYAPALVPGASPLPPGMCLQRMAAAGAPFVRQ